MTITIQVQLFSRFRSVLPAEARGRAVVELPAGATVAQLLDDLGLADGAYGRVRVVNINGQSQSDPDHVLHDGDSVRIFPFVVGG